MAKDNYGGLMERNILVISTKINAMVWASSDGKMEENTKVSG